MLPQSPVLPADLVLPQLGLEQLVSSSSFSVKYFSQDHFSRETTSSGFCLLRFAWCPSALEAAFLASSSSEVATSITSAESFFQRLVAGTVSCGYEFFDLSTNDKSTPYSSSPGSNIH